MSGMLRIAVLSKLATLATLALTGCVYRDIIGSNRVDGSTVPDFSADIASADLECNASLPTDPMNCGACGHVCSKETVCTEGSCVLTCNGSQCPFCDGNQLNDNAFGFWRFDESSGTVANDSSCNQHYGTYGATSEHALGGGSAAGCLVATLTGMTNSIVDFGNFPSGSFDTGDFTAEFWLNKSGAEKSVVLSKRTGCDCFNFWEVDVNDVVVPELDSGGGSATTCTSSTSCTGTIKVNDGLWHHVAIVRQAPANGNSSLQFIYVDGALDNFCAAAPNVVSNANLIAGSGPCVGVDERADLNGSLDELAVYARALSASEVQGHYAAQQACGPVLR